MPVIKIKVCDSSGSAMAGQRVKVSGCEELLSNVDGVTQFLLIDDTNVTIAIKGETVWSGETSGLKREETFSKSGETFTRR